MLRALQNRIAGLLDLADSAPLQRDMRLEVERSGPVEVPSLFLNANSSVPSEGAFRVATLAGFSASVGELVLERGEVGLLELGGVCA